MKTFIKNIRKPLMLAITLMLICGLAYPLLMTAISQAIFSHQANGSMLEVNGRIVGSELLGQDFSDERFMKGRPSAVNYNTYSEDDQESGRYSGVSSGSDNYAASNPKLTKRVEADIAAFLEANPSISREDIPTDLLTASGSGLDPHISPESAAIQIPALTESTGLSQTQLQNMILACTDKKFLGIFGEETVNVLQVNLLIAAELQLL